MSCPVVRNVVGNEAQLDVTESKEESPICVVTRAKAKELDLSEVDLDLSTDEGAERGQVQNDVEVPGNKFQVSWEKSSLQKEQEKEFTVNESVSNEPTDLSKLVMRWFNGILYWFSRAARASADVCEVVSQIIVPEVYRSRLLWLAHEDPLAGHFGVKKSLRRLPEHLLNKNER